MKVKILTLVTVFFCCQMMVNAQTSTFQKGDKALNLGLGFGGYAPSGYQVTIPSFSASYEIGIKNKGSNKGSFGFGGYLGYAGYEEKHTSTTNPAPTYGYASYFENSSLAANNNNYWSVNRIMIGARATFHYPIVDKLDTYGGVTLGIIARSWKWNGSVNQPNHPTRKPYGGDLFVGGRYYFSDKFAAMGEVSFGAYLSLGVSMKI
jgi:DNA-binding transcriptional regulator of glucitol operon